VGEEVKLVVWKLTLPDIENKKEIKMKIEEIAKVCHQVNKAYCMSLGDYSQNHWESAPQWQKDSAINGVKFSIDNPDDGPESSHNNWLKEKVDGGWVYGEVKNEGLKTHPCCVPYNELPTQQKAKDYIFKAIVHSLK